MIIRLWLKTKIYYILLHSYALITLFRLLRYHMMWHYSFRFEKFGVSIFNIGPWRVNYCKGTTVQTNKFLKPHVLFWQIPPGFEQQTAIPKGTSMSRISKCPANSMCICNISREKNRFAKPKTKYVCIVL